MRNSSNAALAEALIMRYEGRLAEQPLLYRRTRHGSS
jgi:hypothetical protein